LNTGFPHLVELQLLLLFLELLNESLVTLSGLRREERLALLLNSTSQSVALDCVRRPQSRQTVGQPSRRAASAASSLRVRRRLWPLGALQSIECYQDPLLEIVHEAGGALLSAAHHGVDHLPHAPLGGVYGCAEGFSEAIL
jgi:hypothetical protein